MKDKVVVFKKEIGARVYVNPGEDFIKALKKDKIPFLVNPDLSQVSGVSPETWRLADNKVLPSLKSLTKEQLVNKKLKLLSYKTPKLVKVALVVTSSYVIIDILFKLGLF